MTLRELVKRNLDEASDLLNQDIQFNNGKCTAAIFPPNKEL